MPTVRALLRRSGRACPRWTLRRRIPCPDGDDEGHTQRRNYNKQPVFFHVYPSCDRFAFQLKAGGPCLDLSRPQRLSREYTSEDGTPPIGHTGRSNRSRSGKGKALRNVAITG